VLDDHFDVAGRGDVRQGIALYDDEVGHLSHLDAAVVALDADRFGGPERRSLDRSHRWNAHLDDPPHDEMLGVARHDRAVVHPVARDRDLAAGRDVLVQESGNGFGALARFARIPHPRLLLLRRNEPEPWIVGELLELGAGCPPDFARYP